jgi:hypothetical protein
MDENKLRQLELLLHEYYQHNAKTCRYDCYNCELGILESYSSSHSCAIETVEASLYEDLRRLKTNFYEVNI